MCKKNIEGSLNLPGIVDAEWNEDTKLIEVVYDTTKIGLDQIKKTIASVGYDNDAYTGENDAYSKLPGCCQYERKLDAVKP
ncbi:MAG: heavy-metal-associated domain-containing protein [Chitinophagales bacterium]|nr:heavy-metal-associated domain-containing protein [Chitinophagales bacterium]